MIRSHIAQGFRKAANRRSLILLLYLVGLGIAAVLAVPVVRTIDAVFARSGFSPDLAGRFDMVLFLDMQEVAKGWIGTVFTQFYSIIPLFIVWKVASRVGLVHALKEDGQASFWEGVSRYTLRAVLLAVIYLLLAGAVLTGLWWFLLEPVLASLEEPGQFWTAVVIWPLLSIAILATFDLMHDYARIRLVLWGEGVWTAFVSGSIWPIRRISAIFLYKFWFLVGLAIWLVPFWLDGAFAKTTIAGMIGAFLLQQVLVLARNGVTVSWIGAEISYFEEHAEIVEPQAVTDSTGVGPDTGFDGPEA